MHLNFTDSSPVITVIIPALNEEEHVGNVVSTLIKSKLVHEVIVVDNGSTDQTANIARKYGARIVSEPIKGFGKAMIAGIKAAKSDWLFKVDADMRNPTIKWIETLVKETSNDNLFVKGYWNNDKDPMPVTNLVARPSLKKFFPELSHLRMPLAGIYLFHSSLCKRVTLPNDWSFDLAIMVHAIRQNTIIKQCYLGQVFDTYKPVLNYVNMSYEIIDYVSSLANTPSKKRYLFVMAHADDLEIWCGGTILKLLSEGHTIKVIIIFNDQARKEEAIESFKRLKGLEFEFFNLDEHDISSARENIKKLSNVLKTFKPDTLTTHHFSDTNHAHRVVHDLAVDASLHVDRNTCPKNFYMCQSYFGRLAGHSKFIPTTFIDISDFAELKYKLIELYQSQDIKFWKKMSSTLDDLNGLQSGVDKAESYEKYTPYICQPTVF